MFRYAEEVWNQERIRGGLSSGEGLITAVRDGTSAEDPGVVDKRLLVIEPEFASVLTVMERSANTISSLIRKAWDGGILETMTIKPIRTSGAHISIIGHITEDELRARLTRTDMANGFANRFLFTLVKRSKLLPFGGNLSEDDIQQLGNELKQIIEAANDLNSSQQLTMTEAARGEWETVYSSLSAERPGLLGAIVARAEPYVLRLALIYALLDRGTQIDLVHLKAGLAVWDYCEKSALYIFGDATGDDVADTIRQSLRVAGASGLTRTEINNLLHGDRSSGRIRVALTTLLNYGFARVVSQMTGGRPVERWFAI
jgi:hypothetical protein